MRKKTFPSQAFPRFPLFQGKRVKPSPGGLKQLLSFYGVELKDQTVAALWQFHQLLRSHNADQDLTRLNAFETIVERHYADCILINAFVPQWPKAMLDIGSGAGFPGIPLKLVNPGIRLTLCEPRANRVEFLNLAIRTLNLKDISVFPHKVTSQSMTTPVDGVICRAFGSIAETLPRLSASLCVGGKAYFMKGPAVREELDAWPASPLAAHYKPVEAHFYSIPNSPQERSLVVMERLQ
jgi:16S rRNA (guanine527-N7)-methyltransferase